MIVIKNLSIAAVTLSFIAGAGYFAVRTADRGISESTELLSVASNHRYLATEALRLLSVQDDATKSMIIQPDKISDVAEQKIKAFDKQKSLLSELEKSPPTEKAKTLIQSTHAMEGNLQKLDEELLESLLGGDSKAALEMFFSKYVPERKKYSDLMESLAGHLNEVSETSKSSIIERSEETQKLIALAFLAMALLVAALFAFNLKRELDEKARNRLTALLESTRELIAQENFESLLEAIVRRISSTLKLDNVPNASLMVANKSGVKEVWQYIRGSAVVLEPFPQSSQKITDTSEKDSQKSSVQNLRIPFELAGFFMGEVVLATGGTIVNLATSKEFLDGIALSLALTVHGLQTKEVIARNETNMKLVLDTMADGLLSADLKGKCQGNASLAVTQWFGPSEGKHISDLLFPNDIDSNQSFRFLFDQTAEDFLPFDTNSSQLPKRIVQKYRVLELRYQQIFANNVFSGILICMSEVTEREALELKEQEGRQLLALIERANENFDDVRGFFSEMDKLFGAMHSEQDIAVLKRIVHTLKGSSASYGLAAFSRRCHEVESEFFMSGILTSEQRQHLASNWKEFTTKATPYFQNHLAQDTVEVARGEIIALIKIAQTARIPAEITHQIHKWTLEPATQTLTKLKRQATEAAQKIGRPVQIEINATGVYFQPGLYDSFFSTLVHVVRNAIDHGLEPVETRKLSNKNPEGILTFNCTRDEDSIKIEIKDDGDGVDWEKVSKKAASLGLAHKNRDDLVRALFADGLTTRSEVSELSGRGVGLAAVLQECNRLGGKIQVMSEKGRGTTFIFDIPFQGNTATEEQAA